MSDTPETLETPVTDSPLPEPTDIASDVTEQGESAPATETEAVPSPATDSDEPIESAGDSAAAHPEPESPVEAEGDAPPAPAEASSPLPIDEAVAASDVATNAASPTPDETAPPATPDEAPPAPDAAPIEGVIVEAIPQSQPIYGGQGHPSPPPDLGDANVLPSEPEQGHGPGAVPGTTEKTQDALPEVGVNVPNPGLSAPAPIVTSDGDQEGDKSDPTAPTPDPVAATDSAPVISEAAPTALSLEETFQALSDTGKEVFAAVNKLEEDAGHVLALELKGLANFAVAISSRIEAGGIKDLDLAGLPEAIAKVIEVACDLFAHPGGSDCEDTPSATIADSDVPDASEVIAELGEEKAPTLDVLWDTVNSDESEEE